MIRSLALVAALISTVSCKTETNSDNSDVESVRAGSATTFQQPLSCSQGNARFSTFGNGTGILNPGGKENVNMTCTSTNAGGPGMGMRPIGSCKQKDGGTKYQITLTFSSGMTTSYQAVVRKSGGSQPMYMTCLAAAVGGGDGDTNNNCPATAHGSINCMPITSNPDCEPARRSWIQANCPGIQFLD